jgi:predicted phosphodiesterase
VRYGVLSDIHANLHALEAAVEVLEREGVATYLFAGDLVGYGPFPNECVEMVAELGALSVAGNHDLIALGRLPDSHCDALARTTLAWTRDVLSEDAQRYLSELPLRTAVEDIVVAHGSLGDPEEYTSRPDQAASQLSQLEAEEPAARILVLGHTHRARAFDGSARSLDVGEPLALRSSGRYVLTPGSVGQSRERLARARFVVLDTDTRRATFYAVPYDIDGCRQALARQGLPDDACHQPPPSFASRVLRRIAERSAALSSDIRARGSQSRRSPP